MKLASAREITLSGIDAAEIDLVIAASGYERRATFIARKIHSLKAARRVALGFTDRLVLNREPNDALFRELGYELISAEGDSDEIIRGLLGNYLGVVRKRNVKIILDYSSMTRVWYAGVIDLLRGSALDLESVDVYFAYTPSAFSKPGPPGANAYMGPIRGFSGLALPDKKIALVIGLGYERQRALGLVEYVEPAETILLFAKPALDERFVREVERNNAEVIDRVGRNNIVTYPIADLAATASILTSLCLSLNESYRVILAPLGPKPLTLLCLLLATRYANFDVWRVSAGEKGVAYNRPPLDRVLVCKTTFEMEIG